GKPAICATGPLHKKEDDNGKGDDQQDRGKFHPVAEQGIFHPLINSPFPVGNIRVKQKNDEDLDGQVLMQCQAADIVHHKIDSQTPTQEFSDDQIDEGFSTVVADSLLQFAELSTTTLYFYNISTKN